MKMPPRLTQLAPPAPPPPPLIRPPPPRTPPDCSIAAPPLTGHSTNSDPKGVGGMPTLTEARDKVRELSKKALDVVESSTMTPAEQKAELDKLDPDLKQWTAEVH